jgi:hypothetical protein
MSDRTPTFPEPFRVTAKLAVSPRGTISVARLLDAFRVDPLARRLRL